MKDKWIFESKWIIFYWAYRFDISYETCGYFDARHRICLDLFFFSLTIILPIYSKHTDECDPPKWGIAYHNQTLWIYRGGKGNMNGGNKWWTFYAPWSLQWVRTSAMLANGEWEHERKGDIKSFWQDEWKDRLWTKDYPYTYILKSGEVQHRTATVQVREREWRWHWFKWLPLTKKVDRSIDINFSDEVGERTGSWKGGCTGCGYTMLPNETPLECLRRMEKERTF